MGPEHRALIIQAIENKETHLLQQLRRVTKSGKPYIRLLNGFYDALMYSSWAGEEEEKEFEIVLSEPFYSFLKNCNSH
ncbi:hypothetical protein AHMF7605_22575 [Adhaeribacter arboris]|uniref:Uncharacterized protein n=1 Tax=Adhaeribacter arboris TaxID=2072846 RepID=A0A2T2YKP9_9BACT|nr:hypothetical protein [Adhaeribacter arboris]PSR56087.1 hypothetical protein AHMF7605_22575 [Adhaeribacter arboris]